MKLSLVGIAGLIAIFQSLFMSVTYISYRKKANTGTHLFSALLFIFALSIACTFSLSAFGPYAFVASYHKAVFLVSKISYLVAPLVYLYVMSLLISDFRVSRDHLIHFVPFIAIELYSIYYLATLEDFLIWTASIEIITTFGILVQTTVYLVLILRLIRQHHISWGSCLHRLGSTVNRRGPAP